MEFFTGLQNLYADQSSIIVKIKVNLTVDKIRITTIGIVNQRWTKFIVEIYISRIDAVIIRNLHCLAFKLSMYVLGFRGRTTVVILLPTPTKTFVVGS